MSFNRVALLYSKKYLNGQKESPLNPYGTLHMEATVNAIEKCLCDNDYEVIKIPASNNLISDIENSHVDIIYNACCGIEKKSKQATVAAMLEQLDIPFVGSGLSAHIQGLYKHIAKAIMRLVDIPTPNFQVFITGNEPLHEDLRFPLMVKPVHEGSGIGITRDSVVSTEGELRNKVKSVISQFNQNALVENFVCGREFTVAVIGNGNEVEALPIKEIEFFSDCVSSHEAQTYDIKAQDLVRSICPSRIEIENPVMTKYIKDCSIKAFQALGCNDFARLDVRMDKKGNPFFLEINTLPGMHPGYSDFPQIAATAGYEYEDLILKLLECAWTRFSKR